MTIQIPTPDEQPGSGTTLPPVLAGDGYVVPASGVNVVFVGDTGPREIVIPDSVDVAHGWQLIVCNVGSSGVGHEVTIRTDSNQPILGIGATEVVITTQGGYAYFINTLPDGIVLVDSVSPSGGGGPAGRSQTIQNVFGPINQRLVSGINFQDGISGIRALVKMQDGSSQNKVSFYVYEEGPNQALGEYGYIKSGWNENELVVVIDGTTSPIPPELFPTAYIMEMTVEADTGSGYDGVKFFINGDPIQTALVEIENISSGCKSLSFDLLGDFDTSDILSVSVELTDNTQINITDPGHPFPSAPGLGSLTINSATSMTVDYGPDVETSYPVELDVQRLFVNLGSDPFNALIAGGDLISITVDMDC
jgi:hypothetical protein